MVVSVGWWTKPLLGKWLEITTRSIHLNSWLFGVLGWCVLHLKVFCNPDSKIWFWLFAAIWEIETHWGHFPRAIAWKTCLVDNGNRSFSVGGWWNLSCSRARYRESLVNRMVISEPCIVCLAATTLSAKISSWPRLILWNHLLLVQWSEFRKNDLPNKYKYLPDPFWRSVARWISSSHPHLDCNTMQWPFLHGRFSCTWPCFSKKETEPCLNSKNCSLTLVNWLIVPLDARWRFTITESFLKGAHERHLWENHPLQNLKNLKWKTYLGKNAVCCLQNLMKLLWKGCGCNWGHEIWHQPQKTACILEGQIPSKITIGLDFLIPSNMGQFYDPWKIWALMKPLHPPPCSLDFVALAPFAMSFSKLFWQIIATWAEEDNPASFCWRFGPIFRGFSLLFVLRSIKHLGWKNVTPSCTLRNPPAWRTIPVDVSG